MSILITKLTSARFLVIIFLVVTTCILAYRGTFPMEAFTGLVTLAVRDYFQRSDRKEEQKGEVK